MSGVGPMLSLYLHIPFCRHKCAYCDFFSVDRFTPAELSAYPGLLLRQMELATGWEGPLASIFFGGGTPSLLEVGAIEGLVSAARARFGFAPEIEISLEANPGTVTPQWLQGIVRAGVNRLSLGAQSADDGALAALGRIHSHAETIAAATAARAAGFGNLSLDLIYGRPAGSPERLKRELDSLLALAPEHFSCYALSVEEGTPLAQRSAAGAFSPANEEEVAAEYHLIDGILSAAGYRHYEISNYARPGYECRHNLGYWRRQPSLGIGAGAHSFRCVAWGERLAAPADLALYRTALAEGRDPAVSLEVFDRRAAMAETLYLGLRTADGVDDAAFRRRFGVGVAEGFPAATERCRSALRLQEGCWRFDPAGWLLYDYWIENFL